jgi:hypothetical protein
MVDSDELDDKLNKQIYEDGDEEMKALIDDTKRLREDLRHGNHLFYQDGKKVLMQNMKVCGAAQFCKITSELKDVEGMIIRCSICCFASHRKCGLKCIEKGRYVCLDCVDNYQLQKKEKGKTWLSYHHASIQKAIKGTQEYQDSELRLTPKATFEKYLNMQILKNVMKEERLLHAESDGSERDSESNYDMEDDDDDMEYRPDRNTDEDSSEADNEDSDDELNSLSSKSYAKVQNIV